MDTRDKVPDTLASHNALVETLYKAQLRRSFEEILQIRAYVVTLDFVNQHSTVLRWDQTELLCRAVVMETIEPLKCIYKKGGFWGYSSCCLYRSLLIGRRYGVPKEYWDKRLRRCVIRQ